MSRVWPSSTPIGGFASRVEEEERKKEALAGSQSYSWPVVLIVLSSWQRHQQEARRKTGKLIEGEQDGRGRKRVEGGQPRATFVASLLSISLANHQLANSTLLTSELRLASTSAEFISTS